MDGWMDAIMAFYRKKERCVHLEHGGAIVLRTPRRPCPPTTVQGVLKFEHHFLARL